MSACSEFDAFSERYDEVLNRSLSRAGESKEYFLEGRIAILQRCLHELGFTPHRVLDFGCGTGASLISLSGIEGVTRAIGVDVSSQSIGVARRVHAGLGMEFLSCADFKPEDNVDLAYCNGVFHHIAPSERGDWLRYVYAALRPSGLFAFWENNPWNPGTHYVMAGCEFDRDAETIRPHAASSLLSKAGFQVLSTTHCFFFPHLLRFLRPLEKYLFRLPLGGQYQVLCKKP